MKRKLSVRTWIEIDKRALFFNLSYFEGLARGARMMAVIKSNAYGHGLVHVARLLSGRSKTAWFGVDSITEALRLRREGIHNPILILGYTLPELYPDAALENISITISNFESLDHFLKLKRRPNVHLKIETGMNRLGFLEANWERLAVLLKKYAIKPEGIYSHLAEPPDIRYSKKQIASFQKALNYFESQGIHPRFAHFAKTEGIQMFPSIHFNMVRLGIGLYGYTPDRKTKLKPVMTWKTIVAEVKKVRKGELIGYGLTERFKRDSVVAVLPIGYWHGYDRKLSSKGEVLIRGKRARVVGRVCMDMVIIDATNIPEIRVRDEVVILGQQGREMISGHEIADRMGTTVYEVITRINPLIYKTVL